jgi:rhamnose utilization protein RhaD (predicted bifunctional aldolase and dehydrogenase)
LAYGIVVWGQNAKALSRRMFTLLKRAEKYMAGLKLESCRDSFRQMKILTVYSLYIQETILYAKNTRNNNEYHRYVHNLEFYNSKPTEAGCILYDKLPDYIKRIGNNNQFRKELKDLLIKGCYYSVEDYLSEEFCNIGYR